MNNTLNILFVNIISEFLTQVLRFSRFHRNARIISHSEKNVSVLLEESAQALARQQMELQHHPLHAIFEADFRAVAKIRNSLAG